MSLDDLTVFLDEAAYVRVREKIEDNFGKTTERHSSVSHDDWPIDEDGVRQHLVD